MAGCSVDELNLAGKACPCVAGWVCNTATNQCVPAGSHVGGGGAGGSGGQGGAAGASCEGQADGSACEDGLCYAEACCRGCWDGVSCQSGTELSQCGRAGLACEACACGDDACSDGICTASDPVQSVELGYHHSCVVLSGGSLWCWGRNQTGQLGLDDTTKRPAPTQVGSDADWSLVRAGEVLTCALRKDTSRWCWGWNASGELGLGDTTQRLVPTQGPGALSQLTVGRQHGCGATATRSMSCWGSDVFGQLGIDGDGTAQPTPVPLPGGEKWVMLSAGGRHSCAVRLDQTLWCWGYNIDGECGQGHFVDVWLPAQVGTEAKWTEVAGGGFHTCARTLDDELWCWGGGLRGQLGIGQDGPNVNIPEPQHVGTESDWRRVVSGRSHACGLRGEGELWCWGANDAGQLGVEPLGNSAIPMRAGSAQDWTDIAAGSDHTCGIRAGGGLWCWGAEEYGQVGSGATEPVTAPTRICLPPSG